MLREGMVADINVYELDKLAYGEGSRLHDTPPVGAAALLIPPLPRAATRRIGPTYCCRDPSWRIPRSSSPRWLSIIRRLALHATRWAGRASQARQTAAR